jgi:fermentation-respiration switch protein FrsA (DUF1100 family)
LITPEQVDLEYRDFVFRSGEKARLHGWFLSDGRTESQQNESRLSILMMHGVAGNISHRVENAAAFCKALDVNVFLFDYRGYGRSSGEPSEEGTYEDAQAAFETLCQQPEVNPEQVILFGHSLGGAVAIDLAVRLGDRVFGLVVESSFTTGREIARLLLPIVPENVLPDFYDSRTKISEVDAPVLITHAKEDELLPTAMGKALYEAAKEPKFFYSVPGAGHSDIYRAGGAPYFQQWHEFIEFCRRNRIQMGRAEACIDHNTKPSRSR